MNSSLTSFRAGGPVMFKEDPEQLLLERRRTLLLHAILATAVLWTGSWLLTQGGLIHGCETRQDLTVLGLGLALLSGAMRWRGWLGAAAWVLLVGHVPLILWCMVGCGSGTAAGGAFLIALVVGASALLGRSASYVLGGLSFLGLVAGAPLASPSLLRQPSLDDLPEGWLTVGSALLVTTFLVQAVVAALERIQGAANDASRQREEVESRYVSARKLEPVGQLAAGVAHDFNNLLSVMVSVSSSLRTEYPPNEEIEEILQDLDEATARASQMTGQLLTFSRKRSFEVEAVDLDDVLANVIPMLSRLLGDEITVTFHGSTEGLIVEADRGQLEQVVLNLAVNARDAMPQGGTLKLTLGRDPLQTLGVYLEVEDTGVGMPREVVDQIFAPFFSTKPTGTGLGLATVQDIVSRLCGQVTVESQPGQGSRFRITLPASRRAADPGRPSRSQHIVARPQSTRILLAEDHEVLRRALRRNLMRAGFSVTSVVSGQEALWLVDGGGTFDLLISDVSMPQLGGVSLMQRLEEGGHAMPTILISGNATRLPKEVRSSRLPTAFLAKPFSQEELVGTIEKLLRKSKLRRPVQIQKNHTGS